MEGGAEGHVEALSYVLWLRLGVCCPGLARGIPTKGRCSFVSTVWTDRAQVRKQAPSGSFHHLLLPASSFACELASMLSAVRAREPTSAGVSLNGKFPIARPWTGLSGSRFDASTPFVAMHAPQQIGQVQRPEIPTSRSSRSAKSCTSWMPHRTGAGLGAFAWSVKLVGHGASRKGGEKNDRTAARW